MKKESFSVYAIHSPTAKTGYGLARVISESAMLIPSLTIHYYTGTDTSHNLISRHCDLCAMLFGNAHKCALRRREGIINNVDVHNAYFWSSSIKKPEFLFCAPNK
jgi:hypothetical protein